MEERPVSWRFTVPLAVAFWGTQCHLRVASARILNNRPAISGPFVSHPRRPLQPRVSLDATPPVTLASDRSTKRDGLVEAMRTVSAEAQTRQPETARPDR